MYCKNCFRKITSDSKFCRYCGAEVEKKKEKRNKVVLGIVIAVVVILIGVSVGFCVQELIAGNTEPADYSDYVGVWQEENSDDVETRGGVRLEIVAANGDNLTISFGIYDGGGAYNGVEVENVNAVIEKGIAIYSFADDGYGNSGKGTLVLNDSTIEWESKINDESAKTFELLKVASTDEDTQTGNMEETWQQ